MSANRGPNPMSVAWSVFRAQRVSSPNPQGTVTGEHDALGAALDTLRTEGIKALPSLRGPLSAYRDRAAALDPDQMTPEDALAYWLNLYNAGALDLAAEASQAGVSSVLRVPGAFNTPWVRVQSEALSLTQIEHGKIRRLGDPRIHGALVCGSASCPSLRFHPYLGPKLDSQLDDQLRNFLTAGGASIDRSRTVLILSRILLWYGGDFTSPQRMPTWLPPTRAKLASAIAPWLDVDTRDWVKSAKPRVAFRAYNWELACSVA